MRDKGTMGAALPQLPEGFEFLGHYEPRKFVLVNEKARKWRGVYVWAEDTGEELIPRRVGYTWQCRGFAGRFSGYNSWLARRTKRKDLREQIVRRLTIKGAGRGMIVLGRRTATKGEAVALETLLRNQWAKSLDLDLLAPGSRIAREMQAWRVRRSSCRSLPSLP